MISRSSQYLATKSAVSLSGQTVGAITGVILDATILATFGIGAETDALFAALAVPAVLADTLDVQLPKVLVPTLLTEEGQHGSSAAARLLLSIALVLISMATMVSLATVACASWLVAVQVPGFAPDAQHLTTSVARIVLWILPLRVLAATLQSGLLARHSYAAPSFAKAVSQLVTLLWILPSWSALGIQDVAIGFLMGAIASIAFQSGMLVYQGFSGALPSPPDMVSAWKAVKLLPVPLVSQGMGESTVLLENWMTSFLAPGVLSSFRYATRIVTATGGIIVGSVVRAALPLLSGAVARGERGELSRRLEDALRLVLLLGGIICILFVFCGRPAVALLFARGRFGPEEAAAVSFLVILFAPSVVLGRVLGVIQLPFYAHLKMRPTLVASFVALGAYIVFAPAALWVAGVYGLPVARLAVLVVALLVTWRFVRAHFDIQLDWTRILTVPGRVCLQFGIACLAGMLAARLVFGLFESNDLGQLLASLSFGVLGLVASLKSALGIRSARELRTVLIPAPTSAGKR